MWRDPIIEEIHRYREEHAAKFNYDIHAIFEDWKREEEKLRKQGRKFAAYAPRRAIRLNRTPVS